MKNKQPEQKKKIKIFQIGTSDNIDFKDTDFVGDRTAIITTLEILSVS